MRFKLTVREVIRDRVVKQHHILRDEADVATQAGECHFANRQSVDADLTGIDFIKSRQQAGECGLAAAGVPHDRQRFARLEIDVDIGQHSRVYIAVRKTHFLKDYVALDPLGINRAGIFFVFLIHDHEQTVSRRNTALQRRIDVGYSPYGLQHQHHSREERDELTWRQHALYRLPTREINNQCDAETENYLRDRHAQ